MRIIIPLRDVQLVEKNDNLVGGAVFPSSMVVTTKGKVGQINYFSCRENGETK